MKKGLFFILLSVFFSVSARADLVSCGEKEIDRVQVQANRDDGHAHANSLMLTSKDNSCNSRIYAFLGSDSPVFGAMVSIALAAKVSDKKVEVIINSTNNNGSASEISMLGIIE